MSKLRQRPNVETAVARPRSPSICTCFPPTCRRFTFLSLSPTIIRFASNLLSASFTPWRIYPPPPPGQLGVEQNSRMDEFLIKRFINQANIFRKSQIFSIVISFNLFSSRTKRDVLALNLLDRKGGNNTVARFAYRRVMIRLVNSTTAA